MQRTLQLAMLEEVRTPEPPIRLSAIFFEPGSAEQVAAELRSLGESWSGLGRRFRAATLSSSAAACRRSRRAPRRPAWWSCLGCPCSRPTRMTRAWSTRARIRTSRSSRRHADGVFSALQGRRLPAKRHPYGMQLRIEELLGDRVTDEGGDLWHRRIEELDAAACALCAHRYAVGHA